jgi:hypothetical protein
LRNGKVLVAGGQANDIKIGAAELYDPAAARFSATASMAVPRAGHSATLLVDGRVLMAGGSRGGTTKEASAEIYDAEAATFTDVSPMATGRSSHTATQLPSGLVLVAGGGDATAELFDPALGRFRATGAMNLGRFGHFANLLADGTVLVTGGTTLPSAEIYDPASETFALVGPTATADSASVATLLADGRVLIVNGKTGDSDLYDPESGTFTAGPSLDLPSPSPPWQPGLASMTPLLDGGVLLIGSIDYRPLEGTLSPILRPMALLFHPDDDSFTAVDASILVSPNAGSRATRLSNGAVLVTGPGATALIFW